MPEENLDENDDQELTESLIEDIAEIEPTPEELERMREKELRKKHYLQVKLGEGENTGNEANLIITEESHGFCNVIKRYLLKDEHVLFASYKKVFYEDASMFINTDGKPALDALLGATDLLLGDLQEMEKKTDAALKAAK